jgi:hypothetical protein
MSTLPYVASPFHSCARCAPGTFVLSHERDRCPGSYTDSDLWQLRPQLCRIARPFRWQDAEPWLYCFVRVWQTRHASEITHTRAETPDRRLVRNVRLLKLHLHLRMGTMVANLRRKPPTQRMTRCAPCVTKTILALCDGSA